MKKKNKKVFTINVNKVINVILLVMVFNLLWDGVSYYQSKRNTKVISISELVYKIKVGEIKHIQVQAGEVLALDAGDKVIYSAIKEQGVGVLSIMNDYNVASSTVDGLKIDIQGESNWGNAMTIGLTLLPFLLVGVMLYMMLRGIKGGNMQALSFGNSRAKRIDPNDKKERVTFNDVAGNVNAKQDLAEIVQFLKSPEKFLSIGATIPKGVLLTGRPGTGKTMLAKAVAGEAEVPFFYLSGSEFVEMFVGVGASRVRDLFSEAKKVSPAIVFIDEIDSIGRSRGIGTGGGNDEREQTLNQILVEMDGFDTREKVIVIAATNRPDVLDTALLRPGRFDRHVYIELPDRLERQAILRSHVKEKPLGIDVDLSVVASRTPGFSGADIRSLLNEAAILAAREDRKEIKQDDILNSIEKVLLGPERKSHLMNEEEKKIVAYHEAGHALVASLLPHADPVHKVSIISRGGAGGYTLKLPERERRLHSKLHLLDDMAMSYGGYAAESLIYGQVTTGPQSDIQSATSMARDMVRLYGMSDSMGAIAYDTHATVTGEKHNVSYSETTSSHLDIEIKKLLDQARDRAFELLEKHKDTLIYIAEELIKHENIERDQFEDILRTRGIAVKDRVVI